MSKPALRKIIDSMPQEQQELHDLLVENGCHGFVDNSVSCPIANYLTKAYGKLVDVSSTRARYTSFITVELPKHIQQFIKDFDNGKYPDLITHD